LRSLSLLDFDFFDGGSDAVEGAERFTAVVTVLVSVTDPEPVLVVVVVVVTTCVFLASSACLCMAARKRDAKSPPDLPSRFLGAEEADFCLEASCS